MATTTGAITARNVVVQVASQDVSGSSNMVSIGPAKEVSDFAVFGDDWQYNVSSIKSWSGSVHFTGAPVTLDRTGGVVTVEAPFTGDGTLTKSTV